MRELTSSSSCGLKESIKNEFLLTLDARAERASKVQNLQIVPFGVFAAPSVECMRLFRDGAWYGCISLAQAVTEAIIRHVWQVKAVKKKQSEGGFEGNLSFLREKGFIDEKLAQKVNQIWFDRHTFHHLKLDLEADEERLEQMAAEKLALLADVEKYFFDYTVDEGLLKPKYPEFWNINEHGETLVDVRRVPPLST